MSGVRGPGPSPEHHGRAQRSMLRVPTSDRRPTARTSCRLSTCSWNAGPLRHSNVSRETLRPRGLPFWRVVSSSPGNQWARLPRDELETPVRTSASKPAARRTEHDRMEAATNAMTRRRTSRWETAVAYRARARSPVGYRAHLRSPVAYRARARSPGIAGSDARAADCFT